MAGPDAKLLKKNALIANAGVSAQTRVARGTHHAAPPNDSGSRMIFF
jgi:hypothetical protein